MECKILKSSIHHLALGYFVVYSQSHLVNEAVGVEINGVGTPSGSFFLIQDSITWCIKIPSIISETKRESWNPVIYIGTSSSIYRCFWFWAGLTFRPSRPLANIVPEFEMKCIILLQSSERETEICWFVFPSTDVNILKPGPIFLKCFKIFLKMWKRGRQKSVNKFYRLQMYLKRHKELQIYLNISIETTSDHFRVRREKKTLNYFHLNNLHLSKYCSLPILWIW